MKLPILYVLLATLCVGCGSISQHTQKSDALATLPADPHQKILPHWVKAIPPYSLEPLFSKAEVDLNSIQENGNGEITVWQRETYEKNQNISPDYSFKIGEGLYVFDCANGTFAILHTNTRKANGDLARSVPIPEFAKKNRENIFPNSLISAEAKLACDQAKESWPNNSHYDFHLKPEEPALASEVSVITPENREEIRRSLSQLSQSQKHNAPLAAPLLAIQTGNNACQAMNNTDGTAPSFELCVVNRQFSHDIYSVRIAGISIIKGIDDDTTRGIEGMFYGNRINLKCDPINQLASDVATKTIEDTIKSLKTSMPKATFEERKNFAISMNLIEIGRHCTLNNSDGIVAKLDVKFPE